MTRDEFAARMFEDRYISYAADIGREAVAVSVLMSLAPSIEWGRLVPQPEPVRPEWVPGDHVRILAGVWSPALVGREGPVAEVDGDGDVWVIVDGRKRCVRGRDVEAIGPLPADAPVDDPPQPKWRSSDEVWVEMVAACTCRPGEGCDDEGDPGCAACQAADPYMPCPADRDEPDPVAETWKEGDWFTIDERSECDWLTVGDRYQVTSVDASGLRLGFTGDDGEADSGIGRRYVTRCDPPVVEEPAARPTKNPTPVPMVPEGQRLTVAAAPDPEVTLPRADVAYVAAHWGRADCESVSIFGRLGDACRLSQEGGQG